MKSRKKLPLLIAEALDQDSAQANRATQIRQIAINLAARLEASLEMIHVENISIFYEPRFGSFFKEYREAQLKKLQKLAISSLLKIRTVFFSGDPVSEIVRRCAKTDQYELIALATHGRKGLNRMVLGSITEEVIRTSKIPVLSIGPSLKAERGQSGNQIKLKLLVGTDFGKCSIRAEAYALDLAIRLEAEVILIHCLYESFDPILKAAFTAHRRRGELTEMYEQWKQSALQKLEKRKKRFEAKGIEVTIQLEEADLTASEVILAEINRSKANFVILGTHSRNFLSATLLGSSARAVILKSTIPVITVRT
ncbi:MAG: universal stress protein [Bdellovibrionales bacterium]|nr:universal stress protein [Oligoflexia bacterium]